MIGRENIFITVWYVFLFNFQRKSGFVNFIMFLRHVKVLKMKERK